jgi:hypothetical protein
VFTVRYGLHSEKWYTFVFRTVFTVISEFLQTTLTGLRLLRRRDGFPVRYGMNSANRVYLYVPYGSHNLQLLFPQTAVSG